VTENYYFKNHDISRIQSKSGVSVNQFSGTEILTKQVPWKEHFQSSAAYMLLLLQISCIELTAILATSTTMYFCLKFTYH